jgi:hypothetical protein
MSERGAGKPSEWFVVWEEEQDVGSLAWATRIARQRIKEGKGAVQIRRRVGLRRVLTADGIWHWTYDEDELVQDAF